MNSPKKLETNASYNRWLQAKVAVSLADPRPPIPHAEVELRMAERIAALKAKHTGALIDQMEVEQRALGVISQ